MKKFSRGSIVKSLAGILALALVAAFACKSSVAQDATRPNVIVILADDQPRSTIHRMPHLQNLREQGLTLDNTVNSTPLCTPGRATLLSGEYTHNTGAWDNESPYGWQSFRDEETSDIAVRLNEAGYYTGYLGRYMHGYDGSVVPGYDRFNAEVMDDGVETKRRFVNTSGEIRRLHIPKGGTQDSVVAKMAENFVKDAEGPFFLEVGFEAPHAPGRHEAKYRKLYSHAKVPREPAYNERDVQDKSAWIQSKPVLGEQRTPGVGKSCRHYKTSIGEGDCLYRNELRSLVTIDRALGNIQQALKGSGELENTYILYYTDNSNHLGEHRLSYGKLSPYESDVNFPLIVRGPSVSTGTTESLVSNTDIAPTIAEIAGMDMPDADGQSLVPVLTGGESQHSEVLIERQVYEGMDTEGPRDVPPYSALRTEDEKYVEWVDGEKEYYNLAEDPHELVNIYASLSDEKKSELSNRLETLKAS